MDTIILYLKTHTLETQNNNKNPEENNQNITLSLGNKEILNDDSNTSEEKIHNFGFEFFDDDALKKHTKNMLEQQKILHEKKPEDKSNIEFKARKNVEVIKKNENIIEGRKIDIKNGHDSSEYKKISEEENNIDAFFKENTIPLKDFINEVVVYNKNGQKIILQFVKNNLIGLRPKDFHPSFNKAFLSIISFAFLSVSLIFLHGIVVNAKEDFLYNHIDETLVFQNESLAKSKNIAAISDNHEVLIDKNIIIRMKTSSSFDAQYKTKEKERVMKINNGQLWVSIFDISDNKKTSFILPQIKITPASTGNFNIAVEKNGNITIHNFENRLEITLYKKNQEEIIRTLSLMPYTHISINPERIGELLRDVFFSKLKTELKIYPIINYMNLQFSDTEQDIWFQKNITADNPWYEKFSNTLLNEAQEYKRYISKNFFKHAESESRNILNYLTVIDKKNDMEKWKNIIHHFYAAVIHLSEKENNQDSHIPYLKHSTKFKQNVIEFSKISNKYHSSTLNFLESIYGKMTFILPGDNLYPIKETVINTLVEIDKEKKWKNKNNQQHIDEILLLALKRQHKKSVLEFLEDKYTIFSQISEKELHIEDLKLFEDQRTLFINLMNISRDGVVHLLENPRIHEMLFNLELQELELITKEKPEYTLEFILDIALEKIQFMNLVSKIPSEDIFKVIKKQYTYLHPESRFGNFGKVLQQRRQEYETRLFGNDNIKIDTNIKELNILQKKSAAPEQEHQKTEEEIIQEVQDIFLNNNLEIESKNIKKNEEDSYDIQSFSFSLPDMETENIYIGSGIFSLYDNQIHELKIEDISFNKPFPIKSIKQIWAQNIRNQEDNQEEENSFENTRPSLDPAIRQIQRLHRIAVVKLLQENSFEVHEKNIYFFGEEIKKFKAQDIQFRANKKDPYSTLSFTINFYPQGNTATIDDINVKWKNGNIFSLSKTTIETFTKDFIEAQNLWTLEAEKVRKAKKILFQNSILSSIDSTFKYNASKETVGIEKVYLLLNDTKYFLKGDMNIKTTSLISVQVTNETFDITYQNIKIDNLKKTLNKDIN
jgi:hypothetical protein